MGQWLQSLYRKFIAAYILKKKAATQLMFEI